MEKHLEKIIQAGIQAPSGENCQPWRFKILNDYSLEIYNNPDSDQSLYSWGQRASYISHGAAFENMRLAAMSLGHNLDIKIFPSDDENLVARVNILERYDGVDPLYQYIDKRVTNRKIYKDKQITDEVANFLLNISKGFEKASFYLTREKELIKTLAKAGGTNEKILFENKDLHDFFYEHITWTEKENQEKSIGFFIDTFELSEKDKKGFEACKKWRVLKILNFIFKLSNKIAQQSEDVYGSATGMGIITVKNDSRESFFEAGRLLQQVWLKATELGLSVQPMTGLLFLKLRLDAGENDFISPNHTKLVNQRYEEILNSFNIKNERVSMLFRLGYSDKVSSRSSRLPIDKVII